MASSAFVSVKTDLITTLQARPGLDNVDITYGIPGPDWSEKNRVFLGRVRLEHDPGPMRPGRVHRNEVGTLEVYCDALVIDGEQDEADGAALALGLELEETVADNRNLGHDPDNGIYVQAVTVRGGEVTAGVHEEGSIARIVYTVQWQARLT